MVVGVLRFGTDREIALSADPGDLFVVALAATADTAEFAEGVPGNRHRSVFFRPAAMETGIQMRPNRPNPFGQQRYRRAQAAD